MTCSRISRSSVGGKSGVDEDIVLNRVCLFEMCVGSCRLGVIDDERRSFVDRGEDFWIVAGGGRVMKQRRGLTSVRLDERLARFNVDRRGESIGLLEILCDSS